jgi:hypothetical protein
LRKNLIIQRPDVRKCSKSQAARVSKWMQSLLHLVEHGAVCADDPDFFTKYYGQILANSGAAQR